VEAGWLPWCDDCSKFWNRPELAVGGRCPTCGARLGGGGATVGPAVVGPTTADGLPPGPGAPAASEAGVAQKAPSRAAKANRAPWHFKVLVVGVTVYMVYRIYWLIEWLPKHI
jgi:hypothetical protein